ncbi:hypothetical protein [Weissella confusa]|uniref:hypothetical protein n=1 Tax=Weissella confusa TaxID=1583 RepID=UPI0010806219|nr:hypothetical protein [Weissella confusa]
MIVNYNEQTYSDLTVVDQLPKGLSLADSYSIFPTATGNDANIEHLKIYRVTFDEQGNKHAQYVTDQFANDIQVTDKTVSVHFGTRVMLFLMALRLMMSIKMRKSLARNTITPKCVRMAILSTRQRCH